MSKRIGKKEPHHSLVIDIGTASVSGAIVTTNELNIPQLIHVEHVPFATGSDTSREALITKLPEVLTELVQKYSTHKPKQIHVVLAAPWHTARARTISSKNEKPVSITPRTVMKGIQDYKSEQPPESGNVDVEAAATAVQVNGYPTIVSKQLCGTSLVVHFYESEVSQIIQKAITDALQKQFPNSTHSFNTFPLVSAVALREIAYSTTFVVLDFSGEITEVAFVYDDSIQHLGTLPIGYFHFARSIQSESVGDALSRLALFGRGELSDEEQATVESELEKTYQEWEKEFTSLINDANQHIPLPHKLFVISDPDPLKWLMKLLERHNEHNFKITAVNTLTVQKAVSVGDGGVYDVFLALAAVFFHTGRRDILGDA